MRNSAMAGTLERRYGSANSGSRETVRGALLLGATVFYTFDDRQARLARAAGLSVRPRSRR